MMKSTSTQELTTFEHNSHIFRLQLIRDDGGGRQVQLPRDGDVVSSAKVGDWIDAIRWSEQQAVAVVRSNGS